MSSFGSKKSVFELPAHWKLIIGGAGSLTATCIMHPVDVLKVKLQENKTKISIPKVIKDTIANDGIMAFTKGFSAAVSRQIVYSTIRYGTYPIIKNMLISKEARESGEGEYLPLYKKIFASAVSGLVGAFCGSPNDLMLIRMQLGNTRGYKNVFDGLYRCAKEEGVTGLWRGCIPTTVRGMFVTVGQVAFYDQFKQLLLTKTNGTFKDNKITHLTASTMAGAVATVITNPVDVCKTRLMNMKANAEGVMPYRGMMDCALKIFKNEGIGGYFKGVFTSFCRLAPVTIFTFLFYEQYFSWYLKFAHPTVYKEFKSSKKK